VGVSAAALAVASLLAASSVLAHGVRPAVTLTVVAERAPVRVAPVVDAPVAIEVSAGDAFESEAEVNGEEIDGNVRWHLITAVPEPEKLRGFIHSSLVAAQ
jgi:hypothetical protein